MFLQCSSAITFPGLIKVLRVSRLSWGECSGIKVSCAPFQCPCFFLFFFLQGPRSQRYSTDTAFHILSPAHYLTQHQCTANGRESSHENLPPPPSACPPQTPTEHRETLPKSCSDKTILSSSSSTFHPSLPIPLAGAYR